MRMIMSAAASLLALLSSAQAGQVWLTMDHVRPYQLERPASNIVIGNPAIADVTVQDSENILLFGKAPGMTNIVITDDAGKTIENMIIRVRSSSDMLTYFRGSSRMTFNCASNCEPTVTVGDDLETFQAVSGQVANKAGQAQGAAEAAGQSEGN